MFSEVCVHHGMKNVKHGGWSHHAHGECAMLLIRVDVEVDVLPFVIFLFYNLKKSIKITELF